MSTEYRLPALPFGGSEATIARWLKQPGEALAPGEPLLVVVNDRVEAVLPALDGGTLEVLLVDEGATTVAGAVVARVAPGSLMPASAAEEARRQPTEAANGQTARSSDGAAAPDGPRRISPVARRIASPSDVDISNISGSGLGGRVVKSDVLSALAQNSKLKTQNPNLESPSPMRRAIAAHMVRSRATSPHAMTAMEVDMGQVVAVRAQLRSAFARRGLDLTYTAAIALAAVEALMQHPLLNSSWSDDGIVLRRCVHLGVAVALPDGLLTPVVRDAQDLNLRGMARAIGDLARRARSGALRPGETSGGTFTITNPGGGAIYFGTPIINQPQSAILGVGAVQARPLVVFEGGADRIAVRPAALFTLAYDARVLDQSHADAFLGDVKNTLERFHL